MDISHKSKKKFKRSIKPDLKIGEGIVDKLIDILPVEMHIPSYQYCGPGTKLDKRLKRGDPGINGLDVACKAHDIAYGENKDSKERAKADKILQQEALKRVLAKDSSLSERAAALGVATMMGVKGKISGNGINHNMLQENQTTVANIIKQANSAIKKSRPDSIESAIKVAATTVKKCKKGKCIKTPRSIKLPKKNGWCFTTHTNFRWFECSWCNWRNRCKHNKCYNSNKKRTTGIRGK